MQIETLIDVDRLIVDQGLYSWMFFFQWGREGYTFQMRVKPQCPNLPGVYRSNDAVCDNLLLPLKVTSI